MNKKILSVFTAMAMSVCTFAGCSDLDKDGNLKENISYETIELNDIRYKVRSDFKDISDHEDSDERMYSYNDNIVFCFEAPWLNHIERVNAETLVAYESILYSESENFTAKIIEGEKYDVVVCSRDNHKEEGSRISEFIISCPGYELSGLPIEATYTVGADEDIIQKLALEWLENVEYIGEKEPAVTSFDCDYYSVDIPADFKLEIVNEEHNGINIAYLNYDNLSKFYSDVKIKAVSNSEFEKAEEYFKPLYEEITSEKNTDEYEIIKEPYETEILGYDCYCMEYVRNAHHGFENSVKKEYAFNKDGVIYWIYISVSEFDGHEQVKADFEKLIDCIKIK